MKASDYIADFLRQRGVTHVYEVVGGMITHLLDSLHKQGQVQVVSVHHEQAASFCADAAGRLTGVPGVALATSGPGATNLLTGIGSCYFDSSPAVFITGQVNRHELKRDRPIRQLGFQETDIVTMAAPITKAAWLVENPEDLPQILEDAFALAVSGRPGPVLVDIPMDVQRADITPPAVKENDQAVSRALFGTSSLADEAVQECLNALKTAKRPLILVGGGVHADQNAPLFREVITQLGVPVVNSLMAVDALPYEHPLRVGLIGSYGNRWANLAIGEADVMLVLGSRLDIRQTGADTDGFKENKTIFHVDCEVGEINNRVTSCHSIVATLKSFLTRLQQLSQNTDMPDYADWKARLAANRADWPDTAELKDIQGINPNVFLHALSRASQDAGAYIADVGQHQMWAAQSLELSTGQRFMTSGGMGAMGFALPAAIGAAFTLGKPVVMIAGDGSFQMNLQELQTVFRHQLPLKLVILNNQCHGMVRQFQESYFDCRYQSTVWGYSAPNFAVLAKAYGIPSFSVQSEEDIDEGLTTLWANPNAPCLLEVAVDTMTNIYPKIAFGHPITQMEPFVKPIEMEST